MRIITVIELEQNLDKYIDISKDEDIVVMENGKAVTILTSPSQRENAVMDFLSLSGKHPDVDYENTLDERDVRR